MSILSQIRYLKIIFLLVVTINFTMFSYGVGDEDVPIEYRIQEGVTFYLGFNRESVIASRAAGDHKPTGIPKKVLYAKGIKDKGLQTGAKGMTLSFKCQDNLSFENPGSISIWIKPVKWKYPKDMPVERNGHRRRLFHAFFLTNYQKAGYLGFQRMSSYKVGGRDSLSFWMGGFKGVGGGYAKAISWPDGEWHNVVLTWDPLQFKLYIDGKLKGQCTIIRKLENKEISKFFSVCCPPETVIDEFIIYDRILNAEQVKQYYKHYLDTEKTK